MTGDGAIKGIHHATMIARDAQTTVDFYTRMLGLRLVKQTVNFDDPGAYHLYFGDDEARPGTLLTFFAWGQVPAGHPGIGTTHHIALATANDDTLLQWKRWLTDNGLAVTGPYDRVYFHSIYFRDPDGLILEIATRGPGWTVDEPAERLGGELRLPPHETTIGGRDEEAIRARTWPEAVPAIAPGMGLKQLHHITAIASDAARTTAFYTETLGMRLVKRTVNFDDPRSPHLYFGVGDGAPGTIVTYFAYTRDTFRQGELGAGMTHHFALEVGSEEAQLSWRERLQAAGIQVTPVLDRQYFKSIYFRDPDGHILEIATSGPGFLVDEPKAALGTSLKLPAWLEGDRQQIEASLTPLRVP
jgi:glyoxalase family protein